MERYQIVEAAALADSRFNDMLILGEKDTISLLEQYGLLLNKGYPQIGKAETISMLVFVPGSDQPLNLSKSIDGRLHYKQRQIKAQFTLLRPATEWDGIQKELESLLQGQWVWFRFRKDAYFWRGSPTVSFERGEQKATVTITATCNPYNYNLTAYLGDDWLWDTFNFEQDTIYPYKTEVKNL